MKSPNGAHDLFICVDPLSPSQHFFSDVGTGIPGLNPMRLELARLKLFQLSHRSSPGSGGILRYFHICIGFVQF